MHFCSFCLGCGWSTLVRRWHIIIMIQFCSGDLRSAGCSMPGCSLLELPVLGIPVFRLLQLAPCKMTLPWCVSLGAPPQACSRDLSEVRGVKAQQSLATWHVATGTTFYSHRNALHLREGKEVGSIWWKRICEVTLESTQGEEEGGLDTPWTYQDAHILILP